MKAKIFDVSRRAAEKFRQMSNERQGQLQHLDGYRSVRAELDAIRTNFRARGVASTRRAAAITVAESRKIIEENTISKAPRQSNSFSASRRGDRNCSLFASSAERPAPSSRPASSLEGRVSPLVANHQQRFAYRYAQTMPSSIQVYTAGSAIPIADPPILRSRNLDTIDNNGVA